jgi:flagellar motor switch/type III secretory pathway protein FliN
MTFQVALYSMKKSLKKLLKVGVGVLIPLNNQNVELTCELELKKT